MPDVWGLSVGVIHYRDPDPLAGCLESLQRQSTAPREIIVLDNSEDPALLKGWPERFPKITFVQSPRNTGYAGGANEIIRRTGSPFVFLCNPDVSFEPEFLEALMAPFRESPAVGIAGGRLLQAPSVLDSTGLVIKSGHYFRDRGQGEADRGQYAAGEIFAISGAAILLKREALEDIRVNGEYFDEDFFVYHEDTDLAWRARLRGWRAMYVPAAVATHKRHLKRASRRSVPRWIRARSMRNHFLEMLKNETPRSFFMALPGILCYEALRFFYVLLREPFLLTAYLDVVRSAPAMWRKRRDIMGRRTAEAFAR